MPRTGKCLCGSVEIKITAEHNDVGACHCEMCRRWSSGPMMVVHVGQDIEITGEENITAYQSSQWAERAFCKQCGTNLYYRLKGSGEVALSVGLLDDQTGLLFINQIFVDEQPDFYELANETNKMTGAEVFAHYAPKDDGDE